MACEVIFVLFLIYYAIEEFIEINRHKLAYFKSFCNNLDVLVIFLGVVCVAFNIYRTITVGKLLKTVLNNPNEYTNFEVFGFWQTRYNEILAIVLFFSWIKVICSLNFRELLFA